MIKINLLPVKETKRRKQMVLFLYAGLLLAAVFALMGWFWWVQYQKVDDLKAQIAKVDEESKGYADKIKEVKDLQVKEASLETFRAIIKSVYDVQKKTLSALDQLAMDLGDDMRLIAIDQGVGPTADILTVKGSSLTQAAIQQYAERLRRPGGALSEPTISDLLANQSAPGMSGRVYTFTIKVKMGGGV
jgi:Tfp pilus assembly protein PilN